MAHDYVLMRSDRGVLYMPEVDLGITLPDYFAAVARAKIGSAAAARDVLLRGLKVRAAEAVEMGIVHSAHDSAESTVEAAMRLGEELAGRKWVGDVMLKLGRVCTLKLHSVRKGSDSSERALKDQVVLGKFDIHSDLQKSYVFKSLDLRWREHRQDLWHARDDNTRTRDELITMVPEGVNRDHWETFVDYRLSEKTKEKDFGRKVSRGEVWTTTHKRPNGTFVNDQAKEISEKIQEYENTVSLSQEISTQDSLAHALGSKEHCGRVRELGLGPCPSQVFGHPSHYYSGMTSSSPSYTVSKSSYYIAITSG
ncbi:putative transposase, Ptta/En/Spm, plant [Sesbania bispinosa]|nr:putative transposase, Ptta/En/Spm, plant [Sesbania bispinosa]